MLSLLLSISVAFAAAPLGRTLDGATVDLGGTHAQAIVFWSMDHAESLPAVSRLEAAGVEVVLVSADAASQQAMIRPFLRAHGVEAATIADPTGTLRGRFGVPARGAIVLVDSNGVELVRQVGGGVDVDALCARVPLLSEDRFATTAR